MKLLILAALLLIAGCNTEAAEYKQQDPEAATKPDLCAKITAAWESIEKYPYVWGGSGPAHGGFDCSGAIYFVQARIGQPVPRTTSRKYQIMARGEPRHWSQGECGDWIWWTFTADRPFGHIGMHITADQVWQSGSSTGPTPTRMIPGGYWDGIFNETRQPGH